MRKLETVSLNELGGRKNNEDAIYPAFGQVYDPANRLFLVCDGVGGQEKGEIASNLITQNFHEFIGHQLPDGERFIDALRYVEGQINDYLSRKPEARGMASTLTVIQFDERQSQARVGWVGDSRIYHIREGQIVFKSKDHSEVQSLIDMGEITEEEALTHPRRNVITRAVNGHTPARMDQKLITDIRSGDYFLLCTDGLLETLEEKQFPTLFTKDARVSAIKSTLLSQAMGHTKDNFSMYLIKVLGEAAKPQNEDLLDGFIQGIKRLFK